MRKFIDLLLEYTYSFDLFEAVDDFHFEIMSPTEFMKFVNNTEENFDLLKSKRLRYLNDIRNETHIVALRGNKIVAVGGVQKNPYNPIQLWIKHISVDPEYKGFGLGREILERIYKFAVEHELKVKPGSFTEEGEARLKHIHDELEVKYPAASFAKDSLGRYIDDNGKNVS